MSELGEWDSFYMIVGSAAGALIGLQFVVMTLIAERPPAEAAAGSGAFATPTIVHFSFVLFLSAIVRVPWHSLADIAAALGVVGLTGLAYTAVVVRRMKSQKAYKPCLEDWLFHAVLPFASYAILAVSAPFVVVNTHNALLGAGATSLLLLFLGIHNAWDAVVYHVVTRRGGRD